MEQKLCDPAEQQLAEQKLVGTFGLWVMGTPKSKCKKVRVEQKSAEQKLCDPEKQKLAEQKLVGSFGLWITGTHKSKCKKVRVEQK